MEVWRMSRCSHAWRTALSRVALVAFASNIAAAQSPSTHGLGRTATSAEIRDWGVNIGPNGEGLPPGGGTAAEGKTVYARRCARCHGLTGTEGPDDRLVGGRGALASDSPRKTVGSYWPYATTLWDYINRAMPFDQPGALEPDEIYATVAYVLFLNEIIAEHERMDAASLLQVRMPNRDGFVRDPRPDVAGASSENQR